MKSILAFFLLFFSLTSLAQTSYPRYVKDSSGQNLIIMTERQAQILDNKTEFLNLFDRLNFQRDKFDSSSKRLLKEKDVIIKKQELQLNEFELLRDNLKNQIAIQNRDSSLNAKKIKNLEIESDNKEKEIQLRIKDTSRAKWNFAIGGFVVGLIFGVIIH